MSRNKSQEDLYTMEMPLFVARLFRFGEGRSVKQDLMSRFCTLCHKPRKRTYTASWRSHKNSACFSIKQSHWHLLRRLSDYQGSEKTDLFDLPPAEYC